MTALSMKKIIALSILFMITAFTWASFGGQAPTSKQDKTPPTETSKEVLEEAKRDFMTDALDYHGSGFTWSELEAEKRLSEVVSNEKVRKQVLADLKKLIDDNALDRAAIIEELTENPITKVTPYIMLQNVTQDPVAKADFANFGTLSHLAEEAMGHDYMLFGFFEEIPQGVANPKKAYQITWKLFRNAQSPFERRLKYSATYRYGID